MVLTKNQYDFILTTLTGNPAVHFTIGDGLGYAFRR
jgi:hypothetical protein